MSESKERTAQIRARHEWLKKACSRDENHEDLKVLGVTPIESLFSSVKPNDEKNCSELMTWLGPLIECLLILML